mgnify:FL=1
MPIGVRDMGLNTVTKLFLKIGMTKFSQQKKDNPEQGDVYFDDDKNCWVIYNGEEWIEVIKKEYYYSYGIW